LKPYKKIKLTLRIIIGFALIIGGINLYWVHVAHRFSAVTEGKVYRSGVMPYEKFKKIIEKYKIKTIIDLRKPKRQSEIDKEHLEALKLNVKHVNIPSNQAPADKTVKTFLEIMDDNTNYPVLIHCYHGEGRAVLFSAIYRIEYEDWNNDKARRASRLITTYRTGFSLKAKKGKYLNNYTSRKKVANYKSE
jgi:protein tyrosine/serine phosphatase